MRHDSTHWLDEQAVSRLLHRSGVSRDGRSEIRHVYVAGERRWNFWDVQDWLDKEVEARARWRA